MSRKYLQVEILRSWARSAVLPALYSFYWPTIMGDNGDIMEISWRYTDSWEIHGIQI